MDLAQWKVLRSKIYKAMINLIIQLVVISFTTYIFLWGLTKYGFERTIIVLLVLIMLRLNQKPKGE